MTIGERIKFFRKQKGLTQEKLSDEIHMSTNSIQRYELGHREPTTATLKAIAKALGIPTSYLLDEECEDVKAIEKAENILNNFIPNNNDTEKALNSFKYLLDYLYINWRQNSTDEDLTNIMNSKMLYDILVNLIDLYSKKH
ncbi:helix-turn-helix domain-containing protein [Clostridium perfringens]|nr:helix-turn-helix transcriptional regulator [Clostridium perfringens]